MIPELSGLTGPDGAAARKIQVTIETIEQIAKSTVADAESDASHSNSSFRNLSLSEGSFGDVPMAMAFGEQHRAAHQVFVDTIAGVVEDLKNFQDSLIASAKAHQGTDDAAYASLVSLGRAYEGHHFHSDAKWQASRKRHSKYLTSPGYDGHEPSHGSGDASGQPSGGGHHDGGHSYADNS